MGVGLVLSGGGTRCVAQLAVVECLQEWNIKPSIYAGASGGALCAALLATGKTPAQVLTTVKELSLLSLIKLKLNRHGLMDVSGALKTLTWELPQRFEDLPLPVSVSATNLRTGLSEIFSSGELLPAVLASCCMPVIFNPVKIGEELYIDAGVTNNFPANAIWGKCSYLLGVHTNPVDRQFKAASVRNVLERIFLLTINSNVKANKGLCHKVLEPDFLKSIKVFDFKKVEEVYEQTLQWLRPQMPAIASEIHQIVG